jgi:thioredoxin reductase
MSEPPFPPGDYPVVVVGSGPGGLQTSYALSRLGVEHAVLSADDAPGGMFRRFPVFQRLISWTKPDAPVEPGTREYEWFDHNSLSGDEPGHRATVLPFMDRSFAVPSRAEMEQALAAFAERTGIRVRYGCRWESTGRDDRGLPLATSDGEYTARAAVFAVGVTQPWRSLIPGIEGVPHYGDTMEPRSYEGQRVFVIGKRNSAFEVASGLLPWARQLILASPRPVRTDVVALSTVSARYLLPYEDAGLGGGTFALDAAVERIERSERGCRIVGSGTTVPGPIELEVDAVIAATGFSAPLRDLGELGVATVGQGRIPALTPYWESEPGSGIYFAGNAMQGAGGLRKHGIGSASAVVHGFRYNARVLARHLAETHLGFELPSERVGRQELASFLLHELTHAPELWAQKSYLARVVDGDGDTGVLPLAGWLDHPRPGSVAVAVEMNAEGATYPAVYVQRGGEVRERLLPPHHLNDFEGEDYRRALDSLL